MAQQTVRVNLMFDANVAAAQNNIQQLASLLQQIATPRTVTVNGGAIQQAAQAASQLQMHLQGAMNVNTGKLDLHRLNTSLKQAGLSVQDLSAKLVASGTQGQQAFQRLATAIAQAGAPAASLGATMASFLKTMGTATMWSLAYGALNKVTETISDAVHYATSLNKALTDIGIVSGMSANQLDDFSKSATKAAKALNSTTTDYAKAALIFYQQGLSGKAVEERANVVTKMAQVTGESAQAVSDQLTAIWNNFEDGTKSLEYYADAITALGAATASSSKEITQGLEKFASIADTVGLSYEYATAALATVVANTRQSADVVGTAFKTLFARIQDLELGETLEDGVTLGKYAKAIQAVGVNIMDQNNQLKDMDIILDELGARWNTLSRAQQTSLAQTVAGMRQYTQFIAIMDNYGDFKVNVDIASDSEGTLTEQWETWAKNYEGAAKRVEQRSNELYGALLKDDFVIGITDMFAGLIGTLGNVAESLGGLGPIILTIIGLFSHKLIPMITSGASSLASSWAVMTGAAQRHATAVQAETKSIIDEMIATKQVTGSQADMLAQTSKLLTAKEQLTKATEKMSASQKREYQQRMQAVELIHSETQALLENQTVLDRQTQRQKNRTEAFGRGAMRTAGAEMTRTLTQSAQSAQQEATSLRTKATQTNRLMNMTQGRRPDVLQERATQAEAAARQAEQRARDLQTRASRIQASQQGSFQKRIIGEAQLSSTDEGWAGKSLRANMLNKTLGMTEVNAGNITDMQGVDFSLANMEKVLQTIPKIRTGMEEAEQAAHELDQIMKKVGSETPLGEDDVTAIKKVEAGFKELATSMGLTEVDIKEVTELFEGLKKGEKAGDSLTKLKAKMQELGISADLFSGDLDELALNMVEMGVQAGIPRNELTQLYNDLRTGAINAEEARVKINALGKEIQNLKPPNMTMGTAFSNLAGQIGTAASSISMLVAGVQMFGKAFDEAADPMTRVTSGISGFAMLLPALTMLINKNTASTTAASLATLFHAEANTTNSFATWLLKAANDAENISLGTTILLSGIMLGMLALIAVAVVGLVVGIKALIDAGRKEEIALENANKKLEEQKKALEEVKGAYDDLKSTIEDYSNAQNAINKLVEGSQAWKEAIAEANEQAIQLLTMYPKLAQYMTSENGRLIISDEGLQMILDEQWKAVQFQQQRTLEAQLVRDRAQREVDLKNAFDGKLTTRYIEKGRVDDAKERYEGYSDKEKADANTMGGMHGDDAGDTHAIAQAVMGKTDVDTNTNSEIEYQTITSTYREIFDQLKPYYESGDYETYAQQLNELTDSNGEVMTAIHEQVLADEKLRKATEQLTQQMLTASWGTNKDFQNAKHKDFITEVSASQYKPYSNASAAKEYLRDLADSGDETAATFASAFGSWIGDGYKGAISDEKAFEQYLKTVYGETAVTVGDNEVVGENYKITGMYGTNQTIWKRNADGGWSEYNTQLSNDQAMIDMANAMTQKALEKNIAALDGKADDYLKAFDGVVDKREGETDEQFQNRMLDMAADFETGKTIDVSKLTASEADALRAGLSEGKFDNIVNEVTGEKLSDAMQKSLDQYDTQVKNVNLQASADWLKNKEERDANELNEVLSEAGMDTQDFEQYVKKFEEYGDAAEDVAKKTLKLSSATSKLSGIFEDNEEIFDKNSKSFDKTSGAYISAVNDVRDSLTDMLGVDLGYDYVEENLESIKKAAEGDVKALDKLQLKAASMKVDAMIHLGDDQKSILQDMITDLENTDISLRPQLFTGDFIEQCNAMIASGKVSMEELQGYFDSIGFYPKYDGFQEVPGPTTISTSSVVIGGEEFEMTTKTEQTLQVPKITGGDYKAPETTNIPTGKTKTKKTGGSKKEKKKNEDEIERYHKIDKTLDSLSKHYDRLAAARDRAFGASHISYLEAELDVLDKQNEAIKQKIAENEAYYKQDRSVMEGYGAVFDEDGNIANYDELVAQQVAMYNKNPEKNEEKYNAFKEALSRYEETLSVMQDLTDQEIENINNSFDTKLAIITYQVELQVRLADNWNDFFEFQLANLTDSVQDLADKLDILGQSFTQTERKLKSTETALKGYLEQGGVKWEDLQTALKSGTPLTDFLKDANFTEEQISSMESELQNMYSYVDELREGMDAISESIVATFEDGHKEFDKATEQMEHFVSLAGAYEDIIDLAGRQALGISQSVLTAIKSSTLGISKSNIAMRKAQLDADKASLEAMKKELALQTDEGVKKEMQETIDEIESQVRDSEEALLDETSTGLQAATDLFQSQMDGIVEAFEDSMTGAYGTFASLKDSYDQKKEQEDWYLEDYERIYELSKLNRDIVNSIDETDSVHAKELLRDLQAEINQLQEDGTDLTKHEVEYLRAKYDLRLAEIALEEAQNAKSQVRMRRDSEGNWGYVYTADENKVGNAMQNYEDKLFAAQKTLDDTIEAMEERLISIPEEFANKVAEIYADQTLNDEERRKRIEETTQHYQTMYANAANLLEATTGKAKELYEVDWTAYSQATGYKISKNSEWVDSFKETFIGTLQGFTSADGALGQFKTQTKTMLDEAAGYYTTYRTNVKEILNTAGLDVQNFVGGDKSGVAQQFQNMATEAGKTSTAVQQLATDFTTAFTTAVNTASGQYSAYSSAISKWVTDTDKLADSINQVIEAYATLNKANTEKKTPSTETTPTDGGDGDKSGNPGGGGDTCSKCGKKKSKCTCGKTTTKKLPVNVQLYLISSLQSGFESVKLDKGTVFSSASLTGQSDGSYYFSGTIKGQKSAVGGYIDPDTAQYLKDAGWKKFDTGGYTGSWDSSGRLAMLHQKELVLNAHDTENFLSALDILREITSVIDLQAAAHSNALSAMTSSHLTSMLQPIEQTVTIHAEFPNATQHSEIEEAFNSLLNRASQFANRKNL